MTPDAAQDDRYFATARREILPVLPATCRRLLDVGCGSGATVSAVRDHYSGTGEVWVGGIEFDPGSAKAAQSVCDQMWTGNVEAIDFENDIEARSLDVILCLDVLEHLVDPWSVVKRLSPLLAPGGRLIISIPNIRHWKFIWRLLTRADFNYRDAGLLDRTHLRFFVRHTVAELASCGGLTVTSIGNTKPFPVGDARWLIGKGSFGLLDDLMIKQFLAVAQAPTTQNGGE